MQMRVAMGVALTGFLLVSLGFFEMWHPLGAVAAGSMLLYFALKPKKA
jgi:hypothetical protein